MLPAFINKTCRFSRRLLLFFALIITVLSLINVLFPLPEDRLEKDYSTVFTDRNGKVLRITLTKRGMYRIKLPLREISPYMVKGMLEYEDRFFFIHPGVNPLSVCRAALLNVFAGRIRSGASTIPMQIARMLYNRPRTFLSKLHEVLAAFQLEMTYSKTRLLEIYLNMIPMGGNIEGVGAASFFYYGKPALSLSYSEALLLIGIPRDPNLNRPDKNKDPASLVLRVSKRISGRSGLPGHADTGWIASQGFHYINPFRCPHLIEEIINLPGSLRLRVLTIDLNIQDICESALQKYHREDEKKGISGGAIIVLNNRTHEVLSYAGSPDFSDDGIHGQVNGASILRSPGSALKPFIYARAIGCGLITPAKLLLDIPKIYEDRFSPVNYDRTVNGPVSAEFALLSSLNIPAIRLEESLHDRGLSGMLSEIFPEERRKAIGRAGLTLAIGGFPVSLEEITALYSALATGGKLYPLKFEMDSRDAYASGGKSILDPRACYIVSEMLSSYHRPDMPYSWEFAPHLAKIALKTGTSFGQRDAWCIGYNPDFTVGVWMGNVSGAGSPSLVGADIAAPVMIEIMDYLTRDSDSWFAKPEGVEKRNVCALSGEKASPDCPLTNADYYIPGVSSEQECSVHKKIWIRKSDNMEVLPGGMGTNAGLYSQVTVEKWPPEIASFLRSTGKKINPLPPRDPETRDPECRSYAKDRPVIMSIKDGAVFILNSSESLENQKIPLKAIAAQDACSLFWFEGKRLLTNAGPDETVFYTPVPGETKLTAVDSMGRSCSVTIKVLKKAL